MSFDISNFDKTCVMVYEQSDDFFFLVLQYEKSRVD